MRIRTIKPEIWESEKVGKLSLLSRLNFIGLISSADDYGRGRASPVFIKSHLHPYANDIDIEKIKLSLDELSSSGLVKFYQVNDCSYYELPGWKEHQVINRKSKSSPHPMPLTDDSLNTHVTLTEHSVMEGKGREGNGRERNGKIIDSKGNDFSTADENQEAIDAAVEFSGNEGNRAFFQKAVKAIGPGLVREAIGEVKMRGDNVSSKSKYLCALLKEWMNARGVKN
jgi:hypothetical protein